MRGARALLEDSAGERRAKDCVQAVFLLSHVLDAALAHGEQDGRDAKVTSPHGRVAANAVEYLIQAHLLRGLQRHQAWTQASEDITMQGAGRGGHHFEFAGSTRALQHSVRAAHDGTRHVGGTTVRRMKRRRRST